MLPEASAANRRFRPVPLASSTWKGGSELTLDAHMGRSPSRSARAGVAPAGGVVAGPTKPCSEVGETPAARC